MAPLRCALRQRTEVDALDASLSREAPRRSPQRFSSARRGREQAGLVERRLDRGRRGRPALQPAAAARAEVGEAREMLIGVRMREEIGNREQEILRLAYEDKLTGLPNRALFNDRLAQAIRAAG